MISAGHVLFSSEISSQLTAGSPLPVSTFQFMSAEAFENQMCGSGKSDSPVAIGCIVPQRRPCPHSQNKQICYLMWHKEFCSYDEVKDLELGRLFQIIQVGPMYSQTSLWEEDRISGGEERRGCWLWWWRKEPLKAEKGKGTNPSQEPLGGRQPSRAILDFWTPELWANMCVMC